MRKWLAMLRPTPWLTRRFMWGAVVLGVGVGGFCWGRHGLSPVDAAPQARNPGAPVASTPGADQRDFTSGRPVAYIYDNIPVTREELGEYLIARHGKERIEFLVNRKIVEMACMNKGIVITESMIEAQLLQDIQEFGPNMRMQDFENQVLKRFNKTLYEWREDVIRPKLALTELVKPLVKVEPQDIQKEFEARYGPKVECRMIVLEKDHPHPQKVWEEVRQSESAFLAAAGKQGIAALASRNGLVPPIHTHFPDEGIEKTAFSLKAGEVSGLIQVKQDKTWVILRCEKHIPADQTTRLNEVHMKLYREVEDRKRAEKIPQLFNELRLAAHPNILPPFQPAAPQQSASAAPRAVPPPVEK
jgi:hypothetical protein